MESGNFGAWPCSVVDDRLDALQANRGQYRFEKGFGGLFGSLNWSMQQAAQEGLFSAAGASAVGGGVNWTRFLVDAFGGRPPVWELAESMSG